MKPNWTGYVWENCFYRTEKVKKKKQSGAADGKPFINWSTLFLNSSTTMSFTDKDKLLDCEVNLVLHSHLLHCVGQQLLLLSLPTSLAQVLQHSKRDDQNL